ncbi:hypothetical protein [Sphingomonas oligoaromativorans]|uniref:hypothetical protein n=1 Tax=Sphingomonas oligoaromativorans TaxID=575322 RepID=UPI001421F3F7|nr:hypothetical protein [Sphingomonas oligoaromativorans]NIJ32994.1 hypothetical protein [Sphingomonas oligoaromativorans]
MIEPSPSPRPSAWWETRAFAFAMIALALVPLLLPPIPPLTDLMGHMGRYRVQLEIDSSPFLSRYYSFNWALIGNLACDLMVQVLGPILGLELAVKLIVMAIPAVTVAGLLLIAREIHGRVPPTALFALPLAYGYPFQFGFINFAMAMGLMLIAFAFWLRLARTGRLKYRPHIFFVVSFLIWVAHSFAWGVLGILCFIAEVVRCRREGEDWVQSGWRAFVACLPLAPPAILLLPWRGGSAPHGTFDWFKWWFKWRWLYSVLRERVELWDEASAAILILVGLSGFASRRPWRRYEATLGIISILLAIVFICLPRVLLSSAYADMRLVPYMVAMPILALRPIANKRVANAVAAAGLLFFGARVAVSTLAFLKFERNYQQQLKALDHVPMGSRVMALANVPCRSAWYTTRMEHLSSMATVRRRAFVNDQWEAPGAQLLRVRYRDAGRYFSHDPSQIVRRPDCRARNEPILELALQYFPRNAFDYVWMIDMPRDRWPVDPDLVPIWEGKRFGVLYRIVHRGAGSTTASNETPKGSVPRVTQ